MIKEQDWQIKSHGIILPIPSTTEEYLEKYFNMLYNRKKLFKKPDNGTLYNEISF